MPKYLLLLLPALLLPAEGCMAVKSTVYLTRGEQALYAAEEAGAPEYSVYYWTMAEELQRKAREEWGYSDFGAAEDLSRKSVEWAAKAQAEATNDSRIREVNPATEQLPDQLKPVTKPDTKPVETAPIWGDE